MARRKKVYTGRVAGKNAMAADMANTSPECCCSFVDWRISWSCFDWTNVLVLGHGKLKERKKESDTAPILTACWESSMPTPQAWILNDYAHLLCLTTKPAKQSCIHHHHQIYFLRIHSSSLHVYKHTIFHSKSISISIYVLIVYFSIYSQFPDTNDCRKTIILKWALERKPVLSYYWVRILKLHFIFSWSWLECINVQGV